MSTRNSVMAVLGFALIVGFLVVGRLLDTVPVGLDTSAFPAGDAIQAAAKSLGMKVNFAYVLGPGNDFVSNPVAIEIVL